MASRASIGGHPIHPMLIPFPIALMIFSFVADLVFLWGGGAVWKDYIAFYTMLGGIIMAALAAVPGLIDWATLTEPRTVKVANWHARINVFTLLVFIADFYLRTSSGAEWITGIPMLPFFLSIVGVIGLAIAGWLGGQLVFAHGVAVDTQSAKTPEPESRRHVRAA